MKYVIKANGWWWNGEEFANNQGNAKIYVNKGIAASALKRMRTGTMKAMHKRIKRTASVVGI